MTLSANAVTWSRGRNLVLDGVTVTAESGATIGLLGPNGSGKSSLLRILAGVADPDVGTAMLDDQPITSVRRRHIARRVAMVDQQVHTEVDVTVLDVVRLGRIPHRGMFGSVRDADDAAVASALVNTGMFEKRNRTWRTLSGGECQRAQIARALAQEPKHLLLDEPTNHLDIQHQLEILELVAELPVTSYIALHDLNLAAMFCDRLLMLSEGKIVAEGAPAEIITERLVWEVYKVHSDVTVGIDGLPSIKFNRNSSPSVSAEREMLKTGMHGPEILDKVG
ncbi:ABC transporter ATP-binding protein [Rhodococcus qingshengii]|uniref:ABC transporter ATP-binding protein n=1 Tax=Rhodococcus qingshengii TaxID=334542 RepID=UPI001C5DD72E|nr:ABC transporter ATP-binding protein [Rhodococcus qingshengii]MBW4818780.1 ABC transporter ATP-binding protein [Rhodococcus qingshengii]